MAGDSDIKIIQITDTHLHKLREGELLGMNTQHSLDIVLDLIKTRGEQPDLILATGDIAQDGSAEGYARFVQKMAEFTCPVIWLPGNHDDPGRMAAVASPSVALDKVWTCKNWKLIFLDSTVRGEVYGRLSAEVLDQLEQELSSAQEKHVALCLHHHPVLINSRWLDNIGVVNGDAFFAITDKYPNIKFILWGHIHQAFDQIRKDVRLLASPSTCVQFKPGSDDFTVDEIAPGYRWLKLDADGLIETAVVRAESFPLSVNLASKGY